MMVNGMLAIGVHGVGGLFGVLCMGIFADGNYGKGWNVLTRRYTINRGVEAVVEGKFGQLASQAAPRRPTRPSKTSAGVS